MVTGMGAAEGRRSGARTTEPWRAGESCCSFTSLFANICHRNIHSCAEHGESSNMSIDSGAELRSVNWNVLRQYRRSLVRVVERERVSGRSTHLIIVHPFCTAVHLYDRIADDIVDKRSRVELSKDEAERVGRGVGEEDKAVACRRLEEVEFVCASAVRREQLVAEASADPLRLRSVRPEGPTHRPDNFLTIFFRLNTTPYTNFASSSNGNPRFCAVPPAPVLGPRPFITDDPFTPTLLSGTSPECVDVRFEKMLSRTFWALALTMASVPEVGARGRRCTPGLKFATAEGRTGRVRCQSW